MQFTLRLIMAVYLLSQLAGSPVQTAQLIEHGATNPFEGITFKLGIGLAAITAPRLQQSHHSHLLHVLLIKTGTDLAAQMAGGSLHQG